MRKSDLQKIIKEELLKELNIQTIQRMNGLITTSELKKYDSAIKNIVNDLDAEGFELNEIKQFLIQRIERLLK